MRRFAITGFPGWLSSALLDSFVADPHADLNSIYFLSHSLSVAAAREQAAGLPFASSVVPFDLVRVDKDAKLALAGVDTLVHTAGLIHVRRTADWYRVNTAGTIALANAAKTAGVRRFVFISSIAAAGKSRPGRPLVEADEPRPAHHYGKSKLLAERGLLALHEPGSFDVVILRPSMFYGPPVPARHIEIYKRLLHGWMPLIGGGSYERCLIYVDNLVQAVRLAIASPHAPGQTYFIADRKIYTTYEVVEAMAEALGTRARYLRLPAAVAETAYQVDRMISAAGVYIAPIHLIGESHWHQAASCQKAIDELGYDPKVELAEGMRHAIEWCRGRKAL